MKKKQFMSKLAALTMAAMMGLSAVPASAVNVLAAVQTDTGSATTVGESDADVTAAKDAVNNHAAFNFSNVSNASDAKTKIGTITAAINGSSSDATVTVDGFNAAVASPATNGTLSGTATWTVDPTDGTNAGDTWYDITVTVPFTATWASGKEGSVKLTAGTASGRKITYANYEDSNVNADAAVNNADYVKVTKADASGKASTATDIKNALVNHVNGSMFWNDTTKTWQSGQSANTVKTLLDHHVISGYEVDKDSVKFTDSKNFTFNVFKTSDPSEVYNVTIAVESAKIPDDVKNALDNFFNVHTFKISKGQTITNGTVAAAVTTAQDKSKDTDDEMDDAITTSVATVYGNTTALTVADGKATGKLSVTVASLNKTFDYTFTANVDQSDSTLSETEAAAIAKINATTYPSYNNAVTNHNLSALETKIAKDLKDAGYNKTVTWTDSDYDTATKTSEGYLKAAIGSLNAINVKLAYSSDQKSADTNKSLLNVLKGTKDDADGSEKVTEHAVTDSQPSDPDDTVTLSADTDKTIEIAANSKLSTTVQATTATKEATKAEVVAAVQKAIDDQLTADGVKDNGVSVTVKAVNNYASSKVTDGHTQDAETTRGGIWTLLVTTSIANDFNGYGRDKNAKTEVKYLVTLKTNKLKKSDAKEIALADKTANITKNYAKTASQPSAACTYTYVEVQPTLTPADSNSEVTYKVVDADGNVVISGVKSGKIYDVESATPGTAIDLYKENSSSKMSVSDKALGIVVTKAGTYKVTATANGHSATATVAINDNFKDVPSTAYFSNAVKWAYKEGITAGTTETTFGSYNDVTRAQFVTWLYKYAVSKDASVEIADSDVKSVFSDVATDKYYAKAVQWAVVNNVTAGTTATTFSPDKNITRAQALTMLWRAMGSPTVGVGQEDERTLKFTDLPTNAAFRTAMVWAIHEGITSGTTPTTCSPDNICPRSQAVTFIYGANNWANK